MLTNSELVIRVGHKYYNWLTAAPIIISQIAFQKSLPEVRSNMLTNPELVIRVGHKYYNWLTAAPIIISQIAFQKSLPEVRATHFNLCFS